MITIDDNMKQRLSRFLDSDGKIMISEDMPDDLKAAIHYLNTNNINLLSENDPLADAPEIDEEEQEEESESLIDEVTSPYTPENTSAVELREDEDIETDDLEELF